MTYERAIKILDPETSAKALAEITCYNGFVGEQARHMAVERACVVACEAMEQCIEMREKRARENRNEK